MKAINRFLQYLDSKGIKPTPFEKKIGLSNGYLGKQRLRKADLGESILLKLVDYCPDLSLIWLLTGEGEMIREEQNSPKEVNSIHKLKTDRLQEDQLIPLYNLEASAGLVELFQNHNDTDPIDTIHIPNLPKCDGAVFVTGDSMYPLLKSGDIVAYKQIEDFANDIFWGEMYLISVEVAGEEYISVKYIQKSEKGNEYIKLVSRNDHHQPKNVMLSKVRAMAMVKASIRINSMG